MSGFDLGWNNNIVEDVAVGRALEQRVVGKAFAVDSYRRWYV